MAGISQADRTDRDAGGCRAGRSRRDPGSGAICGRRTASDRHARLQASVRRQRSLDRPGGLNKGEFLAHRNVHRSEDETVMLLRARLDANPIEQDGIGFERVDARMALGSERDGNLERKNRFGWRRHRSDEERDRPWLT